MDLLQGIFVNFRGFLIRFIRWEENFCPFLALLNVLQQRPQASGIVWFENLLIAKEAIFFWTLEDLVAVWDLTGLFFRDLIVLLPFAIKTWVVDKQLFLALLAFQCHGVLIKVKDLGALAALADYKAKVFSTVFTKKCLPGYQLSALRPFLVQFLTRVLNKADWLAAPHVWAIDVLKWYIAGLAGYCGPGLVPVLQL